MTNADDTNE